MNLSKKQSLKTNITSLGFLQIFNFFATLATLPYLTRTLGVSTWGLIVFIQLVMNYLIWFVNWGFYHGATRRVASERDDAGKLSELFSEVWAAQWLLAIVALLVLCSVVLLIPSLEKNKSLYIAASGVVLGNLLMPLWYLNGLELIRESAIVQLMSKLVAIPFIFLLVHHQGDEGVYLLINSFSFIFVGLLTLLWMYKTKLVAIRVPQLGQIRHVIMIDFQLFLNGLWANLNTTIVPAALGIFGGTTELGYYNLAERARSAAITVLHPVSHALFPRMCYLYANDKLEAKKMLKLSGILLFGIAFLMSLAMYLLSDQVVALLGGEGFSKSADVLEILALSTLLTTVSAFIVNQILIPANSYAGYSIMVFICLIFTAFAVVPAISFYGAEGAAMVTLLSEIVGVSILLFYLKKQKLLI